MTQGVDQKTAAGAFEQVKPQLAQIKAEDYKHIQVDLLSAVGQALQLAEGAQQDRQLFMDTFTAFPVQSLDQLQTYALALWQAETEYRRLQVEAEVQKVPPTELVEACSALRGEMIAAARYLWRKDAQVLEVLGDITRNTGYRDLADDLNRLAELFSAHFAQVQGRSAIGQAELNQAAELGAKLLNTATVDRSAGLQEWRERRHQAWTLLYNAAQDVRLAAAFIFRNEPAQLDRYPSLFVSK